MNDLPPGLARLLHLDPGDPGCDTARQLLHAYAELAATDAAAAEAAYPAVATHLASCGPCAEDYEGLLAALREEQQ